MKGARREIYRRMGRDGVCVSGIIVIMIWGGKDGGERSANAELQNIVGMDLLKCQIKYLMVV
jgi:hypothetical protein